MRGINRLSKMRFLRFRLLLSKLLVVWNCLSSQIAGSSRSCRQREGEDAGGAGCHGARGGRGSGKRPSSQSSLSIPTKLWLLIIWQYDNFTLWQFDFKWNDWHRGTSLSGGSWSSRRSWGRGPSGLAVGNWPLGNGELIDEGLVKDLSLLCSYVGWKIYNTQ